jgi:hypothetical protein
MERGATKAPVMEEYRGKVVTGRQIKAIAQITSQSGSVMNTALPGEFIR